MNKAIRDLIVSNLLKVMGVAGGFTGFAYSFILRYAYKFIYMFVRKEKIVIEEKLETQKELKKYDEIINDTNSTADDIKNAGRDFIIK